MLNNSEPNSPSIKSPKWLIMDDHGKPVCNFIPTVVKIIKVRNEPANTDRICLRLSFDKNSTDSVDTTVLSKDLDHIRWTDIDSRCILNSSFRKPEKFIANIIRAGIAYAPVDEKISLNRLGIHHIDDNIVFVAGDRVITRSSADETAANYILEELPFRLDIDESITPHEAFEGMCELVNIAPDIGRTLVAHTISGIIRQAFKEAGITPSTVLFIIGKSGTLKSHYVPHIVQLYNRSEYIGPETRINSTDRYIEDLLCKYNECTIVIDDLHTGESKSIKRRNNNTAEEIIRRLGDDIGRGRKDGKASKQSRFGGNAILIGEYHMGKESTAARILTVNLSKAPNGEILDKYQRKLPLLVSTFYYYFIQWYVDHFTDVRDYIGRELTSSRISHAGAQVHGRFIDTQFYLQESYRIFLEYCENSELCSKDEVQSELEDYSKQLAELIKLHQMRYKEDDKTATPFNFVELIRDLYERNKLIIAPDKNTFSSRKDYYDGLFHDSCLYVRGDSIDKNLRKIIPDIKREDWVNGLKEHNAIDIGTEKNTKQINDCSGIRFYAVRLKKLKLATHD